MPVTQSRAGVLRRPGLVKSRARSQFVWPAVPVDVPAAAATEKPVPVPPLVAAEVEVKTVGVRTAKVKAAVVDAAVGDAAGVEIAVGEVQASRQAKLQQLRQLLQPWGRSEPLPEGMVGDASRDCGGGLGGPAFDGSARGWQLLWGPKGVAAGSLIEWLAAGDGSELTVWVLAWLRSQLAAQGTLMVIERPPAAATGTQRASAAAAGPAHAAGSSHAAGPGTAFVPWPVWSLGWPAERVIYVTPQSTVEQAWAIEQALRCPGIAATVSWVDQASPRLLRRWQLAVEQGRQYACLIRPETVRRRASWAHWRVWFRLRPSRPDWQGLLSRQAAFEVLRAPQHQEGAQRVELELTHEPNRVPVVSQVVPAAATATTSPLADGGGHDLLLRSATGLASPGLLAAGATGRSPARHAARRGRGAA